MYIICGMILDVSHALQCMMQGHAVEIHTYMVSQGYIWRYACSPGENLRFYVMYI